MTRTAYADLMGKKPRNNIEDQFQAALVEYLTYSAKRGVVWYLIRNHGKRSAASHAKDKAMGLRKGAADLGLVLPPHGQAAFLELKSGRNTASVDQEKFAEDVQNSGAYYACVWDIDTAIGVLKAWGAVR